MTGLVLSPLANPGEVHSLFEATALVLGTQFYWWQRRRAGLSSAFSGAPFAVLMGCLIGAGLGSKAVFWLERPDLFVQHWGDWSVIFMQAGQSVVGGLLGGLMGVELAKKLNGVTDSTGDLFVAPILVGLMVGRVGCFLAGLADDTYGTATDLPWAVDFGDGIARHPTQLYDLLFAGLLLLILHQGRQRLAVIPGLQFRLMLSAYLLWRLAVDGIKPVAYAWPGGLSGIQWVCLLALAVYLPLTLRRVGALKT